MNVTEFSPDKTMYDDEVDMTAEMEEFGTGRLTGGQVPFIVIMSSVDEVSQFVFVTM